MKTKILFSLLAFILIVFISLLFIPSNKNLKIITSPKIFSVLKSSENELIEIELLVNKKDTYYFDTEFISSSRLYSEDKKEIVPLIIKDITYKDTLYHYENESFYLLELSLSIGVESNDYLLDFQEAYLEFTYKNDKNLELFIGEFNYLFNSEIKEDLGIRNLSSTVTTRNDHNTVSGIFIELYNMSHENLVLNNFNLGSSSVSFNNYYLSEIQSPPGLHDHVANILSIDYYDPYTKNTDKAQSILLKEGQSIMLYVPLTYNNDTSYLHRFFFQVDYLSKDGRQSFIVDDLPYISTSIFQSNLEAGYRVYEIPE